MSLTLLHQFSGLFGTVSYTLLLAFCLLKRRDGTTGLAISLAVAATLLFVSTHWLLVGSPLAQLVEMSYLFIWTLFLSRILRFEDSSGNLETPIAVRGILGISAVTLIVGTVATLTTNDLRSALLRSSYELGSIVRFDRTTYIATTLLAVFGLVMLEQVLRNGQSLYQWRSRLLNIALGALFSYALLKAALELLFQQPQAVFDSVHGMTLALLTPLFVLGSLRNRRNPLRINVSHAFVFQTSTLLAVGCFLFALGLGGYYAQLLGNWALALFALLTTAALIAIAVLGGSTKVRRSARVIVAKTFFEYRYDYRERWLRVTRRLGESSSDLTLGQLCIQCMSEVLDTQGGAIYLRPGGSELNTLPRTASLVKNWPAVLNAKHTAALEAFYAGYNWVIDFQHLPAEADALAPLHADQAFASLQFIIPLYAADRFIGVCLLARTPANIKLNWEDYDLLKLIANQAGQTLFLQEADRSLRESRQFQAFNQVTAFVAHDLKTVTAQLKLLHSNARIHRDNPAFIDDMLETIENTVQRMEKLQTQLRQQQQTNAASTDLVALVRALMPAFTQSVPQPQFSLPDRPLLVTADPERLSSALTHLLTNAVDATPTDGSVELTLAADGATAILDIIDTGTGMSREFLNEQLFAPFESTKGLTGMGIGAYQAREYVRSQGGDLAVESEPGRGTSFRIRLPLEGSDG